jgi:hypothetical protein
MTWVGAVITVSGRRTPGTTVLVTIGFDGGEAFGEDSEAGKSTWSITAACPDEEGDNVPIIASVGSDVVVKTISAICVAQYDVFVAGEGVTLRDSTYVTAWEGRKGSITLSQESDSLQPAQAVGIEFDGNDYLIGAAGLGDDLADIWFAAAFRVDLANSDGLMAISSFSNSHGELNVVLSPTETLVRANNSNDVATKSGVLSGGVHILVAQLSGGSLNVWIDGVVGTPDSSVAALACSGLSLVLGGAYSPLYCFDGAIYVAALGTTLTTAQRQRLEAALAAKWG